jgi:hypothetical protein
MEGEKMESLKLQRKVMPQAVHRTVHLTRLNLRAIDSLDGHAKALFHMLVLMTNEKAATAVGRKEMPIRVSIDAVAELLAGAVADGDDGFEGLAATATAHPSGNPYLGYLGTHVWGHCLLHGWERLASHTLALIVLLRAGDEE